MKLIYVFVDHPGGVNALVNPLLGIIAGGNVEIVVVSHNFSNTILDGARIPFSKIEDFGLHDISVASMENLLGLVKPDLVIAGTGGQEGKLIDIIEQTSLVAARNLGIPSMSVLDIPANYVSRWSDEKTGKKLDCLPDVVAVLDQRCKEEMIAEGFPEDKLVITGNPYFDSFSAKAKQFTQEQGDQIRQKIGLQNCQTLFLAALDAFSSLKEECGFWDGDVLDLLIETMPKLPGVGIVVTTHPRSPDKEAIKKIVENSGVNMKFLEGVPSWKVALATDLTIVEGSTVGLEVVLMRVPVISLQPGLACENGLVVSKLGFVPTGFSMGECKDLLIRATNPDYWKELLQKSAGFTTDGKATDRVVELVYSLLKL